MAFFPRLTKIIFLHRAREEGYIKYLHIKI